MEMDPFTQRLLERARLRREKLDTQLSNAGHDLRKRSPLRDANAILSHVPVITGSIPKKSPLKSVKETSSPVLSPSKTNRKSPVKVTQEAVRQEKELDKENGVRSKLQRLGKLYSEDKVTELSSPIHKNEERFAVEEVKPEQKSTKPCARLNRLAALASEINNWEDDLSHPTITKQTVSKAERVHAKMNEQVKGGNEPQPSTSGTITNKNTSPIRPKWERTVLENLGTKSPTKSPVKNQPPKIQSTGAIPKTFSNSGNKGTSSSPSQTKKTPEKQAAKPLSSSSSPAVSNARLNSRFGYNGSPKSSLVQSPGSVLSKASMFESKGTSAPKTKDPAEMTISERMALFERNKGEALIPKAPLTMSVPTKKLMEKEKPSPNSSGDASAVSRFKLDKGRAVEAQRSIFEQGKRTQDLENDILQSVHAERQRELDMLRNRFNRNCEAISCNSNNALRTSESSEGKACSPKNSPVCQVKPTPAPEQTIPPPPPPPPMTQDQNKNSMTKNSPVKRHVVSPPKTSYQVQKMADIKRIKVSPPKPGNIYPNLSNIESTETESDFTTETTETETATIENMTDTETGTEADYYVDHNDYYDSEDEDIGNTSLGRSILEAVSQQTAANKKRTIEPDPDSTTSDISVLDEMDEYLDECLALQGVSEEGPTPPKLNRGGKSPSAASHSFKYKQGSPYRSPVKILSPTASPRKNDSYKLDDSGSIPLMHSVSLYRKQNSQTPKTTPVRVISRKPNDYEGDSYNTNNSNKDQEAVLVQDKVKKLLDDVQKQQSTIGQASQALNFCTSTIEFSESREQVEVERTLLLATHRRQAALNEVQRLKVEGTLKPVVPGAPEVQESGSLTISAITLPLKPDFHRKLEPGTCLHFLCLVRHLETVLATAVVQAQPGDSCLRFTSTLKLNDLFSDFKVTVEVYCMQTRAEILPHAVKYHIYDNGNSKKNGGKTPKKLKQESRLIMPNIQSPAGPSAVRSSSFALAGYVIFSLKEVHRQQFTLNKVPLTSPLEGRLQMHVSCELTVSVDHHGFLTMFEDVSGFGAWHRRWCLLKGATISYWKYPDDEKKKTPIGSLDLQTVTTKNVNLVSRDICARPNTFLLESTRPSQPGDTDSLVMVRNGSETTIRHLLSADTKEDRLEWCAKLNKTLHLIRAWGRTST